MPATRDYRCLAFFCVIAFVFAAILPGAPGMTPLTGPAIERTARQERRLGVQLNVYSERLRIS